MSNHEGRPFATHIPFEIKKNRDGGFVLEGHVARANPQWETLAENETVLTIFQGAHSYISPRWYSKPHSTVPTWSYMIVHVYGKPRLVTDTLELDEHLEALVARYEHGTAYDLSKVPAATMTNLKRGVVGFKISVTGFDASFKLNQTRDAWTFENIIRELEKSGTENSVSLANEMRQLKRKGQQ